MFLYLRVKIHINIMKTLSDGLLNVYMIRVKSYSLKKTLLNKINGRSFVHFDLYTNNVGDYIFSYKCSIPNANDWIKILILILKKELIVKLSCLFIVAFFIASSFLDSVV